MSTTQNTEARRQRNFKAFNETLEEYERLKYRSQLSAMDSEFDGPSNETPNPAKPSASDFICDVEKAIMFVVQDQIVLEKCILTYIMGKELLRKSQKYNYEQRIGNIFRVRSIWPRRKYFTTRRKGHEKA
jgi:hypothetical protein